MQARTGLHLTLIAGGPMHEFGGDISSQQYVIVFHGHGCLFSNSFLFQAFTLAKALPATTNRQLTGVYGIRSGSTLALLGFSTNTWRNAFVSNVFASFLSWSKLLCSHQQNYTGHAPQDSTARVKPNTTQSTRRQQRVFGSTQSI